MLLSQAIERLEQQRQLLRRQPCAGIAHVDANPCGCAGVEIHHDRAARLVVLGRVGQQVDEHLLQPRSIGGDVARDGELREGHADPAGLCLRFGHGLAFLDHFGQRRRLERERQLPRLDLRQIKDLVDQLQEIPSCAQNLVDAPFLRRRRRRGVGFHQLGEAEDRIER